MRHLYTGTTEYVAATITSSVTLDAQVVEFRFGPSAGWITGAWTGTAATQRQARVLINSGNIPAAGTYDLYVRVTDSPEIPIVNAGRITVH